MIQIFGQKMVLNHLFGVLVTSELIPSFGSHKRLIRPEMDSHNTATTCLAGKMIVFSEHWMLVVPMLSAVS